MGKRMGWKEIMAICYIDEVGCSSIAGPVVVCAVAVSQGQKKFDDNIKDSKQLSKVQRESLAPKLKKAFDHSVVGNSVKRIEEINIHWAKYEAMRNAVVNLIARQIPISKVIVDGKFEIPDLGIPQEAVVKADEKFWQVGVASIIAKTTRDRLMAEFAYEHLEYSYYDWENNAGYYSPKHRMGIILHGPCDLHRKKFSYFQYCLARHNEYREFIKNGGKAEQFFKEDKKGKKSDYVIWKESKKDIWKPILPKER
jgi:ribonuclease HII